MNEQTTKLIEQLATKLGTTVEYLYNVLIQQARVEIITFFVVLCLTIAGSIISVFLLKYTQKYWSNENAPVYIETLLKWRKEFRKQKELNVFLKEAAIQYLEQHPEIKIPTI